MKIKPCLYYLGLSCFPISILSLVNIFYSFYFNYLDSVNSYLLVFILSLIFGLFLFQIGKKEKETINIYEQIFLIFLIYFLISFLILIPIYSNNYGISFIDAYFESISGLTGTGFSIVKNIKIFDEPLILWRSSSQWIGGFYFLIFLVLIFSNKQFNFKLTNLSFNFEKKINFSPNLISVSNRIFFIYIFSSLIILATFLLSGMRIFDGLNLTMTVISSGGFIPTNSLDQIIVNNTQEITLCFAFLVSILNFYLFYNLILARENIKEHKEDIYLLILIIFFSITFYLINDLNLSSVFLNVISSIGTSGISVNSVPDNFGLYFIILTLFGGSVLSTTSGLKFLRIYILIKAFFLEINKLVKPNVVIDTKMMFSEKKINNENIKISFLIFILFFFNLFILNSILLIDYLDFENSFKLSILTLTNTVSSNIYGMENIDFSELFLFSKISLIIYMVIAKVEFLAVLILVRKVFFKN